MLYNGAESTTADQILQTLSVGSPTRDDLNTENAALLQALTSYHGFDLTIANSGWARDGFPIKQDFKDRLSQTYHALVQSLDFSSSVGPDTINHWVDASTHHMIPSIVPNPLPQDAMLYLINATYFNADWEQQFNPTHSANRDFTLSDGSKVQVPTLYSEWSRFKVLDGSDGSTAVELPYKGGEISMIAVLPPAGHRVEDYASQLDSNSWNDLVTNLTAQNPTQVLLQLPKLDFDYEDVLNDVLKSRMGEAFTQQADLQGISDTKGLYVSQIKQKTHLTVDEKGTRAAAVTSIGVGISALPMGTRISFDRPYFFAIRDNATGAILFLGTVNEPEGGKLPARPSFR